MNVLLYFILFTLFSCFDSQKSHTRLSSTTSRTIRPFIITSLFEMNPIDKISLYEKLNNHPNIKLVKNNDHFFKTLLIADDQTSVGIIVDGFEYIQKFFIQIEKHITSSQNTHINIQNLGVVFVHRSPFFMSKFPPNFFSYI